MFKIISPTGEILSFLKPNHHVQLSNLVMIFGEDFLNLYKTLEDEMPHICEFNRLDLSALEGFLLLSLKYRIEILKNGNQAHKFVIIV